MLSRRGPKPFFVGSTLLYFVSFFYSFCSLFLYSFCYFFFFFSCFFFFFLFFSGLGGHNVCSDHPKSPTTA